MLGDKYCRGTSIDFTVEKSVINTMVLYGLQGRKIIVANLRKILSKQ